MTDKSTFVKVDRNILHWRWYQDANTFRVFLHLILMANVKDHDFEKITVHRGEFVTSLASLSRQLNISVQSARTALDHLKATGEITSRIYPHYRVISIVGYDRYQAISTKQPTSNQQAGNKQPTSNQQQSKNDKNGKNEKNVCGTTPTLSEVESYFSEMGRSSADASKFYHYNQARGWKIGKNRIENWQSAANIWIGEQPDVEPSSNDDDQLDDFGRPIKRGYA